MNEDKCPFCGAEIIQTEAWRAFKCGTYRYYEELSWYRRSRCYERQIAQLQERLEAWRAWHKAFLAGDGTLEQSMKLTSLGE